MTHYATKLCGIALAGTAWVRRNEGIREQSVVKTAEGVAEYFVGSMISPMKLPHHSLLSLSSLLTHTTASLSVAVMSQAWLHSWRGEVKPAVAFVSLGALLAASPLLLSGQPLVNTILGVGVIAQASFVSLGMQWAAKKVFG